MTLDERIRGIALNDVGYDDINIKNGVRYSDYIGKKYQPNAYTTPKPTQRNTSTSISDYDGEKKKRLPTQHQHLYRQRRLKKMEHVRKFC